MIKKDEESEVDNSAKVDKNENDLVDQKSSREVENLAEENGEEDNWFVADQATTCIEEVEVVYDIGVCSFARKAFDVTIKAFSSVINYLEDNANSEEVCYYVSLGVVNCESRYFFCKLLYILMLIQIHNWLQTPSCFLSIMYINIISQIHNWAQPHLFLVA